MRRDAGLADSRATAASRPCLAEPPRIAPVELIPGALRLPDCRRAVDAVQCRAADPVEGEGIDGIEEPAAGHRRTVLDGEGMPCWAMSWRRRAFRDRCRRSRRSSDRRARCSVHRRRWCWPQPPISSAAPPSIAAGTARRRDACDARTVDVSFLRPCVGCGLGVPPRPRAPRPR